MYLMNMTMTTTLSNSNIISIDIPFTSKYNNILTHDVLGFVQRNQYTNIVFNPKQLTNLFGSDRVHIDSTCITMDGVEYSYTDFDKMLHTRSYQYLCEQTVFRLHTSDDFHTGNLLVLGFVGSICRGKELVDKIVSYRNTYAPGCAVAICIAKSILPDIKGS